MDSLEKILVSMKLAMLPDSPEKYENGKQVDRDVLALSDKILAEKINWSLIEDCSVDLDDKGFFVVTVDNNKRYTFRFDFIPDLIYRIQNLPRRDFELNSPSNLITGDSGHDLQKEIIEQAEFCLLNGIKPLQTKINKTETALKKEAKQAKESGTPYFYFRALEKAKKKGLWDKHIFETQTKPFYENN